VAGQPIDEVSNGAPTLHRDAATPDLWQLYATHRLALVRLAFLLLGDAASAEDVVQDAFARAQAKWGRLRKSEAALGYLRSAVVNGARSTLRRRAVASRFRFPPIAVPSAEASALLADDSRAVVVALRRLPRRHQEVLILRYWGGLSEKDIAAALGIAPGTVKSAASRGIAALERTMGDRR
jgi:RNA polymerase sigma-70 factor (sigma-E family)